MSELSAHVESAIKQDSSPSDSRNWAMCDLHQLVDTIGQGWSPQCDSQASDSIDEWAVIKTTAIQPLYFCEQENKRLPLKLIPKIELELRSKDILITRAGPRSRVAICCMVNSVRPRLILCDKAYRLRVNSALILPQYLTYFLNSPKSRELLDGLKTGISESGVNLTQQKFLTFRVPLSPLPEQERIVDKLDTVLARVDACRERLNRVPLILKRFRQSVLAAATSGQLTADWRDARRLDETHCNLAGGELNDWKRTNVGEILEGIQAGLNLQCKERPPEPHERGLVKISAVTWGRYNDEESKTLPDEFIPNESIKIEAGDFLISRANTLELVGACVIVDKVTRPVYLSDKVLRLVMPESIKKWMLYCLRSRAGRDQIENLASGNQLSMRNLSQANLKSILISLPSKIERLEIVRRVEVLFAFADRLEARLATARAATDRLTPALLAKAFRGELVPQDPNDEPAAELLKRLAVARTATSDKPRRGRAAKVEKRPSDHPSQVAIAEI